MELFNHYSLYAILVMLFVATVANGIILYRSKTLANLFLLSAFFLYSFVLTMNLFFGPSASFDAHGQKLIETQAILSITQTLSLELLAHVLLASGFSIKAYKVVK